MNGLASNLPERPQSPVEAHVAACSPWQLLRPGSGVLQSEANQRSNPNRLIYRTLQSAPQTSKLTVANMHQQSMSSLLRNHLAKPHLLFPVRRLRTAMATATPGPLETSMRDKLMQLLQPTSITLSNDSWQHRHHAPMRAQGGGNGETHFSIEIVSDAFKGKNTMQRHRMVYSALSEEFAQGLHALSLKTKTQDDLVVVTQQG